jgi:NADP-dependent 3-hydroxy acid dehydrogenase YdfG
VKINLKEPYQVEKKFSEALFKLGGQLDVLILCHGYIKHESIIQTNILEWDSMMNLNVRTHFQLISLAIPFLKKQMDKDRANLPTLLR